MTTRGFLGGGMLDVYGRVRLVCAKAARRTCACVRGGGMVVRCCPGICMVFNLEGTFECKAGGVGS
jgi:hypothetical protein